jgi:hypothetical protein
MASQADLGETVKLKHLSKEIVEKIIPLNLHQD